MPRKTLADYSPAMQAQILGGLHPVKAAHPTGLTAESIEKAKKHFRFVSACKTQEPSNAARYFVAAGLPPPVEELQFAPPRRWRIDYAWPHWKVGLEVDGSTWTNGRHTRGSGWIKDTEKLNTAAILGWRMLRCTPQQLKSGEMIPLVRQALGLVNK